MISLSQLRQYKANGTKFSCLTCYDATFAHAMQTAQIDTILIGDSLGMVIQGQSSTVPVTVADMAYHTRAVARGNQHALILADLPFMSYATIPDAIQSATTLGLTPQSVNVFCGYKVQGKTRDAADRLLADCQAVVDAGAAILLLECVPSQLAAEVQARFEVPVIGIGAGAACDGQVLVMHDMLGLHTGKPARFVRNFMQDATSITDAFAQFHQAVREGSYPAPEHAFHIELN